MGMYQQFTTDKVLEQRGVEVDYGDFIVTIARAGNHNKKYRRILTAKSAPYRRAIATDTMDDDKGNEVLMEVYAEAVILNWQRKSTDPETGKEILVQGIEGPDGETIPFTRENVITTFKNLPDLFVDVQQQANRVALFREHLMEDDAGN